MKNIKFKCVTVLNVVKTIAVVLIMASAMMAWSVEAQAGLSKYKVSSGFVLSWDKKYITLLSDNTKIKIPRYAVQSKTLRRGQYVDRVTYKTSDTPYYKSFVKALKKARPPASTTR